ncbi:hypothetical protein HYC85_029359 [Camellia sinensis]|uniref:Uncharacterized protein n=1 Tax=Camellia sinensis TaxID=4442 RepID=A0A7J7G076_CAMSI|nr:hypothetical protein HYC85_029359 [Camellia sinensis]
MNNSHFNKQQKKKKKKPSFPQPIRVKSVKGINTQPSNFIISSDHIHTHLRNILKMH